MDATLTDAVAPSPPAIPTDAARLEIKAKELELRLKELDIEGKEYEQKHRPSVLRSAFSNPAVIAAAIAAWATLSATGVTWLSGQIAAQAQQQFAADQLQMERFKFELTLITEAIKNTDPDQEATAMEFLTQAGLIHQDLGKKAYEYFLTKHPREKPSLPSK